MRFVLAVFLLVMLAGCGSSNAAKPTPAANVNTAVPQTSPVATPKGGFKGRSGTPAVVTPPIVRVRTATPIPARAYTAVVYGTVMDAKDKSPISGATVAISGTKHQATTNAFGRYTLKYPARIQLALVVDAQGYAGALAMGQLSKKQRAHVNFKLRRVISGQPVQPPAPTTFGNTP